MTILWLFYDHLMTLIIALWWNNVNPVTSASGRKFQRLSVYQNKKGWLQFILEVFTTEPGMQFYTANGFNGRFSGRTGRKYESCAGFALETEHYPDSPNKPNFPSTVLRPEEIFHSITIFKFSVTK